MKKLLFTLIMVTLLIGCDANQLVEPSVATMPVETKTCAAMVLQSMPDYLSKFVDDISRTLPVTKESRNMASRTIESVIPIIELNDTLMWIINYSNQQGYLVLSTDQDSFPILACNDEGCFDSNAITNPWIDEQKDLIRRKKRHEKSRDKNLYSDLWDKIVAHKLDIETSYELVVGNDAVNTRNDYLDIQPILFTQWGNGWGYHYEMPVVKEQIYGTHKARIPDFVVTLGQYLHHYRLPLRKGLPTFDYNKMMLSYGKMVPSLDKPNEIASMMRFICDHLKYEVSSFSIYVNPRELSEVVSILWDFGFPQGYRFSYWWSQSGKDSYQHVFDDIYDCLKRGYPIIGGVVYKQKEGIMDWTQYDNISYTFIIDGIRNVNLRVTEKSVLETKTYTYQSYQLRYMRPTHGNFSNTGPDILDGKTTGWYDIDYIQLSVGPNGSHYHVYTACVTP